MCNCQCTNTVNVPIQTYEKMKEELEFLKKEVEKKTIIKTEIDPHWADKWWSIVYLSIAAGIVALIVWGLGYLAG